MSKLREIKRRITSIKNIAKVTNAMQMVAASRMRRAQALSMASKSYAEKVKAMLCQVSDSSSAALHPVFDDTYASMAETIVLVVFSTGRGLAGSLPGNVLRYTLQKIAEIEQTGHKALIISIGKKIGQQLSRHKVTVLADFSHIPEQPTAGDIRPITRLVEELYLGKKAHSVMLIYPDFINAVTFVPVNRVLLPLSSERLAQYDAKYAPKAAGQRQADFLFEPSARAILDSLIPRYLETQLYQARLETVASEYSARMVAMKNATDNARDLNQSLQLTYNKSRQALITQELSEIVAAGSAVRS